MQVTAWKKRGLNNGKNEELMGEARKHAQWPTQEC